MTERVYLDHAAGAPLLPRAREAMDAVWTLPGNPSSLHTAGRTARRLLEESRESVAECLGARPSEVVFTSGGTEANNLVLLGAAGSRPERPRLAIGGGEHPSVAGVVERLPDRVDVLPLAASGRLADGAEVAIGTGTALASVMSVNNETGVVQQLDAVIARAREVGAWVHTDAVQAFGHLPLDFAALGVDAMTVTAHKLGGPVGIGALVIRRELTLAAPGFGGGQERRVRSGTAMTALATGFAAAARVAVGDLAAEAGRLAGLREALLRGIMTGVADVAVNGEAPVSPAILNVTFAGCRADDLLLILDAAGIDCSTGSACTAGVHQPSEVLLAMGRSVDEASASLRFSLGRTTDSAAVERVLTVLPDAVGRARAAFG
ncbi:MAG: cysteine desulfurase family protein [Micropruina sp.]|uniref:cysteine desulfurase family protein n=1 Tax=Micropruina sp. TaxID=2737536 RepID=UPI0039E29468